MASIAGPAIAGVLVGLSGAGAAMLFDAASFAVSVLFLSRLRPRVADAAVEETPPPFFAAMRAGWAEIRSRRWIMAGLGALAAYHTIVPPAVYVLGPVTVSRGLEGPGAWAAVIDNFAAAGLMPLGTALAGPLAAAFGDHATLEVMSAAGVACAPASLAVPEVRSLPRGARA